MNFVNPYPAKWFYLIFQPLEDVSRYRDPQPEVVENYSYLLNMRPNIYKSFHSQYQWFNQLINRIIVDICRDQQARG